MIKCDLSDYALILHHGWAGNKNYWKNFLKLILEYLEVNDVFVCESGYYNNIVKTSDHDLYEFIDSKKSNGKKIIGIGHSIGFAKLLDFKERSRKIDKVDVDFHILFGLQSAIDFLGNVGKENSIGVNNWRKISFEGYVSFVKYFNENPCEALKKNFSSFNDVSDHYFIEENLNLDLLNYDLSLLQNKMGYLFDVLNEMNYHIFASMDDKILPHFIIKDNFPSERVTFCPDKIGHSLGFNGCEWLLCEIFKKISESNN